MITELSGARPRPSASDFRALKIQLHRAGMSYGLDVKSQKAKLGLSWLSKRHEACRQKEEMTFLFEGGTHNGEFLVE